jgi:hypothetical protein
MLGGAALNRSRPLKDGEGDLVSVGADVSVGVTVVDRVFVSANESVDGITTADGDNTDRGSEREDLVRAGVRDRAEIDRLGDIVSETIPVG